ncbi:hypothetical protein D3C77_363620 [compost metagenome]
MAKTPARAPSTAAKIAVAPSARRLSASASRVEVSTPCSAMNLPEPRLTRRPSIRPRTPLPTGESKSIGSTRASLRSVAARRMASARGCSLPRSRLAASRSSSASLKPAAGCMAITAGRPSVRVPVLSMTMVSIFSKRSSASAFLISTPAWAPRPTPTMIDSGVARPSAQGQAMISTDTAATRAKAKRGSGPKPAQTANAIAATRITAGTNQPETRSAMRWMGARLRWAWATICTIWESRVSAPTFSARMTKEPVLLMAPPITLSPGSLVTGMDSPVTMDSSIATRPSTSSPSTGTFSPGRTRRLSPTRIWSSPTSSSVPSARTRRAVLGARSSRALMAPDVCSRARSSRTWPSSTSTVMTAAASK